MKNELKLNELKIIVNVRSRRILSDHILCSHSRRLWSSFLAGVNQSFQNQMAPVSLRHKKCLV